MAEKTALVRCCSLHTPRPQPPQVMPVTWSLCSTGLRYATSGTSVPGVVLSSVMATVSGRRSSRLAPFVGTLLSAVLAFQLTLAGGGILCLMPHDGAMSSMQPMQASSQMAAGLTLQRTGQGSPTDQPCDGQSQPAQCVTMTACAPSAIPVASAVARTTPRVPAVVVSAPTIVPLSQTSAPELPPPRA